MALFQYYGTLAPNEGRRLIGGDAAPQNTIIANSEAIQVGDAVERDADGFIVRAAVSGSVGALVGIVVGVADDTVATDPDANTTDTFTVASDNETVAKKYAIIDTSKNSLYTNQPDAALGTTTGSDLPGYFMDLATGKENQLDESTSSATTGQFFSHGPDPDNSTTHVIVNINEALGQGSST